MSLMPFDDFYYPYQLRRRSPRWMDSTGSPWDSFATSRDWMTTPYSSTGIGRRDLSQDWMTTPYTPAGVGRRDLSQDWMTTPYTSKGIGSRNLSSWGSKSETIREMEKKFDELVRKVDRRFTGMLSMLDDPEPFARQNISVEHEGKTTSKTTKLQDFNMKVDVQDFKPEEVKVKVQGGQVLVHAKRENRDEGDGMFAYSCSEFKRAFILPEGVSAERLTSSLSRDGILQIDAPVAVAIDNKKTAVPVTVEHTK
uniref:Body wall muscle protein HR-29 n=1 Tax=Halocynthia roretzi TaxID=7729 RepID=HR29_HALRO